MAKPVDWPDDAVILYDGFCVLCSGWVQFVIKRDKQNLFRFTPITSPYGRRLAETLGIDPDDPDTNALVLDGKVWLRSEAAIEVVSHLLGWGWAKWLRIFPLFLRDAVYTVIARTRYRVFGRHQACDVGAGRHADKVITG